MTDSAHVALLPSLVGEVMLCAQDRGKARQGAFRVLVAIGRKMRDAPNPNGPPDGSGRLMEFISMVNAAARLCLRGSALHAALFCVWPDACGLAGSES